MNESGRIGSTEKKLLFLCTGNYYRSRFAAILLNALAPQAGLDWKADSRGTAPEMDTGNVGPISVYALQGLQARGVPENGPPRFPMRVEEEDMAEADLVIGPKEAEHRAAIEKRFVPCLSKVAYWHINDLDVAPPETALAALETEIKNLIQDLVHESKLA
jgi:protein-tyrosine phosphatase